MDSRCRQPLWPTNYGRRAKQVVAVYSMFGATVASQRIIPCYVSVKRHVWWALKSRPLSLAAFQLPG